MLPRLVSCFLVISRVSPGCTPRNPRPLRPIVTSAASLRSAAQEISAEEVDEGDNFERGLTKETLDRWSQMSDKEKRVFKGLRAVGGPDVEGGRRTVKYEGLRDDKVPRWYDVVAVEFVPEAEAWTVTLDGRLILTRSNKPFLLPTEELALLVASDWEAQPVTENISFARLSIMQLACKAIDDANQYRAFYERELGEVLAADLVCVREAKDPDMRQLQSKYLDPIVAWFHKHIGLQLDVTKSMDPLHPRRTNETLFLWWSQLTNMPFMAFHAAAQATKSVVIPFMLWHDAIDAETATRAVQIEEDLQTKRHGKIPGAWDLKEAAVFTDVAATSLFLRASGLRAPDKAYFDSMNARAQLYEQETSSATMAKEEEARFKKSMAEFISTKLAKAGSKEEREALSWFATGLDLDGKGKPQKKD